MSIIQKRKAKKKIIFEFPNLRIWKDEDDNTKSTSYSCTIICQKTWGAKIKITLFLTILAFFKSYLKLETHMQNPINRAPDTSLNLESKEEKKGIHLVFQFCDSFVLVNNLNYLFLHMYKAPSTRAIFLWQILCGNFYLLV